MTRLVSSYFGDVSCTWFGFQCLLDLHKQQALLEGEKNSDLMLR